MCFIIQSNVRLKLDKGKLIQWGSYEAQIFTVGRVIGVPGRASADIAIGHLSFSSQLRRDKIPSLLLCISIQSSGTRDLSPWIKTV
jgi:hypothetical protein